MCFIDTSIFFVSIRWPCVGTLIAVLVFLIFSLPEGVTYLILKINDSLNMCIINLSLVFPCSGCLVFCKSCASVTGLRRSWWGSGEYVLLWAKWWHICVSCRLKTVICVFLSYQIFNCHVRRPSEMWRLAFWDLVAMAVNEVIPVS